MQRSPEEDEDGGLGRRGGVGGRMLCDVGDEEEVDVRRSRPRLRVRQAPAALKQNVGAKNTAECQPFSTKNLIAARFVFNPVL